MDAKKFNRVLSSIYRRYNNASAEGANAFIAVFESPNHLVTSSAVAHVLSLSDLAHGEQLGEELGDKPAKKPKKPEHVKTCIRFALTEFKKPEKKNNLATRYNIRQPGGGIHVDSLLSSCLYAIAMEQFVKDQFSNNTYEAFGHYGMYCARQHWNTHYTKGEDFPKKIGTRRKIKNITVVDNAYDFFESNIDAKQEGDVTRCQCKTLADFYELRKYDDYLRVVKAVGEHLFHDKYFEIRESHSTEKVKYIGETVLGYLRKHHHPERELLGFCDAISSGENGAENSWCGKIAQYTVVTCGDCIKKLPSEIFPQRPEKAGGPKILE